MDLLGKFGRPASWLARPAGLLLLLVGATTVLECEKSDGGGPCSGVWCSSRGFCVTDGSAPYCSCLRGYHPDGLECASNDAANPCLGVDCAGHGTCHVEDGYPLCACNDGFRLEGSMLCLPGEAPGPDGDADADDVPDWDVADDAPEEDVEDVWECSPDSCNALCVAAGFEDGTCIESGSCSCSGGGDADADGEDVEDAEDGEVAFTCPGVISDGCGTDEVCANAIDDDCDESVDEDCPCLAGSMRPCFSGPPLRRNVGQCRDGSQRCEATGTWGACTGGQLPAAETCDGRDEDCDLCADNGVEACSVGPSCPAEVAAVPPTWFPLSCSDFHPAAGAHCTWTLVPASGSTTLNVEDPLADETRVYLDVAGHYIVGVTVTDPSGGTGTCALGIKARRGSLRIEMWWNEGVTEDSTSDVDLHLHRNPPTTGWFTTDDCYYSNCVYRCPPGFPCWGTTYTIAWGYPDSTYDVCGNAAGRPCRNPRVDIDDVEGWGPEVITVDGPPEGAEFRVMAHYYDRDAWTGYADVKVRVLCSGIVRAELGPARLSNDSPGSGDLWRAADIRIDDPTGITCTVTPLMPGGDYDVQADSSRSAF